METNKGVMGLMHAHARSLGTSFPSFTSGDGPIEVNDIIFPINNLISYRVKTPANFSVMSLIAGNWSKKIQGRVVIRPITFRSDWSYFMNF